MFQNTEGGPGIADTRDVKNSRDHRKSPAFGIVLNDEDLEKTVQEKNNENYKDRV